MAEVIVYTTESCPLCKRTKEWLKENDIDFEEKDVTNDEEALMEMAEKAGQMALPVVDIDGQIIVGYNEEAMKTALGMSEDATGYIR